jgi:hypothetical protein
MKKAMMYVAMAAVIVSTMAFAYNKGDKDLKYKLEHLSGKYADAKPYNYGKAWGKRVFTFNKGRWTLVFTLALDPAMNMPVFEFRTYGSYSLQEKSATLADTYHALFLEEKKFVTLKTGDEKLIQAFGFVPCGMTKDVEQDISITGCSAWKSVADCPGDYDLLSLDKSGQLYFGERPADNDMCSAEKRPTKLTPPVVKIK